MDLLSEKWWSARITCANLAGLYDAKLHPEQHIDRIVHVGSFSTQFVQLTADLQEEYLSIQIRSGYFEN